MLQITHLGIDDYQSLPQNQQKQICADSMAPERWSLYWSNTGTTLSVDDKSVQHVEKQGVHLWTRTGCSGAIYIANLKEGEEYHFPYRGEEHFLIALKGGLQIKERNCGKNLILAEKQTMRFSRTDKKPLIDIRAIGSSPLNEVAWVVIHTYPKG